MFDSTLSIDLGASYTKVALRKKCVPSEMGQTEQYAKLLMVDGSPLIPTIAIRTGRKSQPWVFGQQAAKLNPAGMQVFQNWKANLFRPKNDQDSAGAVLVAGHFFDWLREKVEDAGVLPKSVHVRIALPAFRNSENIALVIARCMDLSGWDSPLILRATEPHANVVGLFSNGRNVSMRNAAGSVRLHYGATFDFQGPYIQAARSYVLQGTRTNLFDALVIDIGAFTVDFAAMTFDFGTSDGGDGLKIVREESHALGVVHDLDRPVLASLGKRHNFDSADLSFTDQELLKHALYHGKPHTLLTRGRGSIRLGDDLDLKTVDAVCSGFSDAIRRQVEMFLDAGRRPSIAFITGGGAKIVAVAENLKGWLRSKRISVVPIEDEESPTGQANWRKWEDTGEGLNRLATALGCASTVLQDSEELLSESRSSLAETKPAAVQRASADSERRLVPCRCQGGNKDCCFCGGRGQYYNK